MVSNCRFIRLGMIVCACAEDGPEGRHPAGRLHRELQHQGGGQGQAWLRGHAARPVAQLHPLRRNRSFSPPLFPFPASSQFFNLEANK